MRRDDIPGEPGPHRFDLAEVAKACVEEYARSNHRAPTVEEVRAMTYVAIVVMSAWIEMNSACVNIEFGTIDGDALAFCDFENGETLTVRLQDGIDRYAHFDHVRLQ
ncbi:hypothetical protein [Paraburkholderia guartelaensis]|uniref:Uncharacterized protein n=1 Tax=Paraburkholderia guartelaensis TaxID=2546446 RepID=A0ABU9SJK1_9BURK